MRAFSSVRAPQLWDAACVPLDVCLLVYASVSRFASHCVPLGVYLSPCATRCVPLVMCLSLCASRCAPLVMGISMCACLSLCVARRASLASHRVHLAYVPVLPSLV